MPELQKDLLSTISKLNNVDNTLKVDIPTCCTYCGYNGLHLTQSELMYGCKISVCIDCGHCKKQSTLIIHIVGQTLDIPLMKVEQLIHT